MTGSYEVRVVTGAGAAAGAGAGAAATGAALKLAESFGMPAWRCGSADDFGRQLRQALTLDVPSLIVVPIDYSVDVAISEQLGAETVAT